MILLVILNVSKQITLYCYRRYFVHRGYQNDTRGIALARDTVVWRSSIVQHPLLVFLNKIEAAARLFRATASFLSQNFYRIKV